MKQKFRFRPIIEIIMWLSWLKSSLKFITQTAKGIYISPSHLTKDAAGGSVNEDAVLVDHVDDDGDLALVLALPAQHGHPADLHELLERHGCVGF